MLELPTLRRFVDILLDQVPNRGGHDQRHKLGAPILEEKSFHFFKALYPAPVKYCPRCPPIGHSRAAEARTTVSRIVLV